MFSVHLFLPGTTAPTRRSAKRFALHAFAYVPIMCTYINFIGSPVKHVNLLTTTKDFPWKAVSLFTADRICTDERMLFE